MSRAVGRRAWAVPGGRVPFGSTGDEPAFTSFDALCVLNAGDDDARVEVTLYYEDREPVGPYRLRVGARRVRHVRLNDLIDPEAMPLDEAYAALVTSDVPVVVQFTRQDTRQAALAQATTMAWPVE